MPPSAFAKAAIQQDVAGAGHEAATSAPASAAIASRSRAPFDVVRVSIAPVSCRVKTGGLARDDIKGCPYEPSETPGLTLPRRHRTTPRVGLRVLALGHHHRRDAFSDVRCRPRRTCMATLALRVNGGNRAAESDGPDGLLLYVIRNDLGLARPAREHAPPELARGAGRAGRQPVPQRGSHARVIRAVPRAAATQGGRRGGGGAPLATERPRRGRGALIVGLGLDDRGRAPAHRPRPCPAPAASSASRWPRAWWTRTWPCTPMTW